MDIKDQYGNRIGRIESDGIMKDQYGNRIGHIDNY
jgi:hypothetical protein